MADSFSDYACPKSLVEPMSIHKSLVAPNLNWADFQSNDLTHDCGSDASAATLGMDVHSNNVSTGSRHPFVVILDDDLSYWAGDCWEETHPATTNNHPVQFCDPKAP